MGGQGWLCQELNFQADDNSLHFLGALKRPDERENVHYKARAGKVGLIFLRSTGHHQ